MGYDGVDKRIDVLAAAIRFGGTVFDLQDLELAYAPPFSSAKDPNNMAGYVAGNVINGDMPIAHWDELEQLQEQGAYLLDVREPIEYHNGHIPGSVNIPLGELRDRLEEIPRDRTIVTNCAVGVRAYFATRILLAHGFQDFRNLSGGYLLYETVTRDLEIVASQETRAVGDAGGQGGREIAAAAADSTEAPIPSAQPMVSADIELDACGLQCPGPIIQVFNQMQRMKPGQVLKVKATDPGFTRDIAAWCSRTGNTLLDHGREESFFFALIRKGEGQDPAASSSGPLAAPNTTADDKTMVVFSGDLDKAIAAFIIANGAASMGRRVTLFFTFWGLNILRRPEKVSVSKSWTERLFGRMMPRGTSKLGLSRMNMLGIGGKMIRKVMQAKNVDSLEALIGQAKLMGVRLVACQMSMDVMGIKPEELIDGVEIGGVASYLAAAEESNVNLFI